MRPHTFQASTSPRTRGNPLDMKQGLLVAFTVAAGFAQLQIGLPTPATADGTQAGLGWMFAAFMNRLHERTTKRRTTSQLDAALRAEVARTRRGSAARRRARRGGELLRDLERATAGAGTAVTAHRLGRPGHRAPHGRCRRAPVRRRGRGGEATWRPCPRRAAGRCQSQRVVRASPVGPRGCRLGRTVRQVAPSRPNCSTRSPVNLATHTRSALNTPAQQGKCPAGAIASVLELQGDHVLV